MDSTYAASSLPGDVRARPTASACKATEPLVSVVIPYYSHAGTVAESIRSVYAQSYRNWELNIVDDGSAAGVAGLVPEGPERSKVRVHRQDNAGTAAARNTGLRHSTGDLVAFLDDDDVWPPDSLEWRVRLLIAEPEWAGTAGTCVTLALPSGAGTPYGYQCADRVRVNTDLLLRRCPFVSPGQVVLWRSVIETSGGFDEALWGTDDYDLWFRIAKDRDLLLVPRLALYYRLHSGNTSHARARMLRATLDVRKRWTGSLSKNARDAIAGDASRWLWDSYIGPVVAEVKRHAGLGQWRMARTAAREALKLAAELRHDWSVALALGRRILWRVATGAGQPSSGSARIPNEKR